MLDTRVDALYDLAAASLDTVNLAAACIDATDPPKRPHRRRSQAIRPLYSLLKPYFPLLPSIERRSEIFEDFAELTMLASAPPSTIWSLTYSRCRLGAYRLIIQQLITRSNVISVRLGGNKLLQRHHY